MRIYELCALSIFSRILEGLLLKGMLQTCIILRPSQMFKYHQKNSEKLFCLIGFFYWSCDLFVRSWWSHDVVLVPKSPLQFSGVTQNCHIGSYSQLSLHFECIVTLFITTSWSISNPSFKGRNMMLFTEQFLKPLLTKQFWNCYQQLLKFVFVMSSILLHPSKVHFHP
jgi:hypothetical protein